MSNYCYIIIRELDHLLGLFVLIQYHAKLLDVDPEFEEQKSIVVLQEFLELVDLNLAN